MNIKSIVKHVADSIKFKCYYALTARRRMAVSVLPARQTVDYIVKNRCSLGRFGDGELNMVLSYIKGLDSAKSGFQCYDATLGKRLYEILVEGGNDKFKVGLPGCMFSVGTEYLLRPASFFWQGYIFNNLKVFERVIDNSKEFLETNISRFYLSHKDKSGCADFLAHMKSLWCARDVVIVEGEQTCLGAGNDLFDNAKSVRRILAPATNAWGRYDDILRAVTEHISTPPHSNVLIIIALGMTATVLAHDLSALGYQAVDLGHIDIEYEWMRMGATKKVAVPGKFTNESRDGHIVQSLANQKYLEQIICRITQLP